MELTTDQWTNTKPTNTTWSSSAPAAPGCGRRSSRRRMGVKTALVCKSLLGKAHTVMAEGGVAAALANVDTRDNWQVHFRDTMQGRQVSQPMADGPAPRPGGARPRPRAAKNGAPSSTAPRTAGILQRNFGGHTYPRLAHVGDRTGLEMIRTLQDKGVHQGIDVHMECTIRWILKDGDRVAGCFGYQRESGRFVVFQGQGGRAGHRRHRPLLGDHVELVGIHGRRPRDGHVGRGRPDRHGVRAVPPHRHGLAAERARHADHRRRPRRRRRAAERQGQAVHVRLHPGHVQRASTPRPRKKPTAGSHADDRRASGPTRGGRRSC